MHYDGNGPVHVLQSPWQDLHVVPSKYIPSGQKHSFPFNFIGALHVKQSLLVGPSQPSHIALQTKH